MFCFNDNFYFYSQFVPHFQTEITQWAKIEKSAINYISFG